MDLTALYATFSIPAGAHLVSDHGQVALLVVTHDHPNHVTVERRPLGACVSLEEALRAAYVAGGLPTQTLPIEATPVLPSSERPAGEQPEVSIAGELREPCKYGCGMLLNPKYTGRHYAACPKRSAATSEQQATPPPPEETQSPN